MRINVIDIKWKLYFYITFDIFWDIVSLISKLLRAKSKPLFKKVTDLFQ